MKKKNTASQSAKFPWANHQAFMHKVLAAHGRKQAAALVAEESKKMLRAGQAWALILPPDGSKPFALSAPAGLRLGTSLPAGLIRAAAETHQGVFYDPKAKQKFQRFDPASAGLKRLAPEHCWEALRQKDLAWLGRSFQRSAWLAVPLSPAPVAGREPKPASQLLVIKKEDWRPQDWHRLAGFLPLAQLALGMIEQKKRLEKRLRQSSAISEIAQNINATMEVDILMRLILLEVTKSMQCQAGDIWLKNEKQSELVFHSSFGLSLALRGRSLAGEFTTLAVDKGETQWVENIREEPRLSQEAFAGEGLLSLLVVPLRTKNKTIGVMHLFSKQQRAVTSEERILLKTLANQAATVIDNARLFEETKRRAQELLALFEVAQVISEMSNLDSALGLIVARVGEVLNVEKCWLMFPQPDSKGLSAHASALGLDEEQIQALNLPAAAAGISRQVFESAKPFFTNTGEEEQVVSEFRGLFTLRNLMAVPLRSQEQTLGVFLAANKRDQSVFSGNDVRLFRTLASEATVIIHNANLYDKLRRSYRSVVEVISDMVDAREPYTLGHSQRVAKYASTLAHQLDLPEPEVERIRLAGLLHDIGKIGISETILLKPGPLSPGEYQTMKKHSEIGVQILKDVEFPWEVRDLILHHHEHYNGRGYPAGLAGEAIPLGARIIAVCDALDVITSDRNYHQAKTPWEAFRIIRQEAGAQFDPGVVAAFEQAWPRLSEEIDK